MSYEYTEFGNGYKALDLRADYNGGYSGRPITQIREIIIHHSAFEPDQGAREAIERTRRYHEGKGWPGIGYHFAVDEDGIGYYVGDILTVRYHATSASNPWSIGVEVLGDFSSRSPSRTQFVGLQELVANLQFALGDMLPVKPHRNVVQTACPGEGMMTAWRSAKAFFESGYGWEA